jgi:phosphoribosyl 1,2-cyclic phosphate phosphodiesterase
MALRMTILGCGASGGVPRIGRQWGHCDPTNPKNRRRRCALLAEKIIKKGTTTILVDTPPDLREQMLMTGCDHVDGVLFTHDHADHTHGIDDLRGIAYQMKARVHCYFDQPTRDSLTSRFSYCFSQAPDSSYPPILVAHDIEPGKSVKISGAGGAFEALAVPQVHGDMASLGFRFGDVAYSPDISDLPEASIAMLEGLDVWIVDALRREGHTSHLSLKQALAWIERLKPKRAILTHMTSDLDYAELCRELPAHVEPAYDGMVIDAD